MPVSPNASPESTALLRFISSLSGKHTLTGQHNYPDTKDTNTQFATRYIGKMPVVYSQDMGHAKEGHYDSYLARPEIVKQCIRQHQLGALVTLCWHAVPPTADEPITFRAQPGATPGAPLASVQGQLQDQQYQDLLTPGTAPHTKWCEQVDVIAGWLKQLQEAHVPVMWRPYHEMNGSWFWWGGRIGEYGTKRLYIQLYDRLVNHHKLNNLIWLWSVDRPTKPGMAFADFYPGDEYVDMLTLDVYGSDFAQSYYDDLVKLSKGKPIALGEVGTPPTMEILNSQPKWTYWVVWADMARFTPKRQYRAYANDQRILFLDDPAYVEASASYRSVCGLPALVAAQKTPRKGKVDLSGTWTFNDDMSVLDSQGFRGQPDAMEIVQKGNDLKIKRSFIVEYAESRVTEESYPLDGKEIKSEFRGSPRITTVVPSETGDAILFRSVMTINQGGQTSEMVTREQWAVEDGGKSLSIRQISTGPRGERKLTLVYDRK